MTAQAHEKLIIDGEETSMAFCPPIPEDDPRIEYKPDGIMCSGCWRGYVGTWEIANGKFYLKDLSGDFQLAVGPLFAQWFSGVLRVPRGEMLHYVHMGFGSVYEEELHIKIEKGHVVKTRVLDNRKKNIDKRNLHEDSYPLWANRFNGDDL
ncbi:hypothetical protein N9089_03460 [Crocinitomicaceae bacterium]|nr:hypothetical protein [Crocinitomicaceae bacterium]